MAFKRYVARKYPILKGFPVSFEDFRYELYGSGICLNSMPKSGTHLLIKTLDLLRFPRVGKFIEFYNWPENDRQDPYEVTVSALNKINSRRYIPGHFAYHPGLEKEIEERKIKMLLILRDPRDVVVSHVFHVLKRTDSKYHSLYKSLDSLKTQIILTIKGVTTSEERIKPYWLPNIARRFEMVTPWIGKEFCHVVKFEELIGPSGGGDRGVQSETILKLCDFIGLKISKQRSCMIGAQTFSPKSSTFRKGQIGSWREVFDEEIKMIFKQEAGDLLSELGYEEKNDW